MTHNYPKTRKPRTTEYAQCTQLINTFGLEEIESIWKENGMYKTAEFLSKRWNSGVSPSVIRYLSDKYNWKRTVTDKTLAIYQAYLRGTVPDGYYKHIDFN